MTRVLLLIAGMLFFTPIHAVNTYIVTKDWVIATTRENGDPLLLSEIAYHSMYRVDCNTGLKNGEIMHVELQYNLTILFWSSPTPVDCFILTTTDTAGRVSVDSEVFHATQYGAPSPVECVP